MRFNHQLTRIVLTMSSLTFSLWCTVHQHATNVKIRFFRIGTLHVPYFSWNGRKDDCNAQKNWGGPVIMCNDNNKLIPPGSKVHWLGYGNYEITRLLCNPHAHNIVMSQHFWFDKTHLSIKTHPLPPSYRNIISKLIVGKIEEFDSSTVSGTFDIKDVRFFTLPLSTNKAPLNVSFVDDELFNILLLSRLTGNYPWKSRFPSMHQSSCWIVQVEDDELITVEYTTNALHFPSIIRCF